MADGGGARRVIALHHRSSAGGCTLHEHQQVPRQIRHSWKSTVAEEGAERETDSCGCVWSEVKQVSSRVRDEGLLM